MTASDRVALERFRAAFTSSPQRLSRLAPGATEDELCAFRGAIGVELPEVWFELYRWRNGTRPPTVDPVTDKIDPGGKLCGHRWLSLDDVLRTKASWASLADEYRAAPEDNADYACRHDAWIPLMTIDFGELAWSPVPCFGGPAGQLIWFDFKGGAYWTIDHASLADWLVTWAELAERDLLDADYTDAHVDAIFARLNPQRRTIEFPSPPTPDQFG